jgi:hypothetical protein
MVETLDHRMVNRQEEHLSDSVLSVGFEIAGLRQTGQWAEWT